MTWATIADNVLKTAIGRFKTEVTYTRLEDQDNPISLAGVFDKNNQEVNPETGVPVNDFQPTLGIRLADLPAPPAAGDTVTVSSVVYEVLQVEEDSQAGARLVLGRRAA